MNFTVSLNGTSNQAISVAYSTSNGTATAGSDYTAKTGTATISAGSLSTVISVPLINDLINEGNETFNVNLTSVTAGTADILDGLGVGTILENDTTNDDFGNAAVLTGVSANVTATNVGFTGETGEPNHATISTPFNSAWWTWTAPSSETINVDTFGSSFDTTLAVYTGTAINSLTTVASNNNASKSTKQSALTFNATAGTKYSIAVDGYNTSTGSIKLNLSSVPTINIADLTTYEGQNGEFTVTLSSASATNITVNYATSDGTALAGSDYTATTGTLTIAAGQTTAKIPVPITNDGIAENNETFNLTLSNPSTNASISDGSAIGTIVTASGAVNGTPGNDTLTGASVGGDTFYGYAGADVFKFTSLTEGVDVINGFDLGADKIDVSDILTSYTGTDPLTDGYIVLGNIVPSFMTQISIDPDGSEPIVPTALAIVQQSGLSIAQLNNVNNFIF
jgi:hypothetical protein